MAQHLVPPDEREMFIVPERGTEIDVRIGRETVWLTPAQMAKLFERELSVIHRHIRNTFSQGEVPDEEGYRQNLPITSPTGGRPEVAYSLDVIISVGYRVKSKRGVDFRRWATQVIKERLIGDYRKRAGEAAQVLAGLKNIELLAQQSNNSEVSSILVLIEKYARSWQLLFEFDEKRLPPPPSESSGRIARITYRQALDLIERFRKSLARKGQAADLFGKDRGDGLANILANLEQTWGGVPVYPNVETRAAHLLYFVIKNHPFLDGNKRIGSLLFLHYLDKNKHRLLDENTLVALALLVAESDPKHKDIVIRLILSLMQGASTAEANAEVPPQSAATRRSPRTNKHT